MGIRRLECPECGATASIGVPEGAEVREVSAADEGPAGGPGKHRVVACERDHEVHVRFVP